MDAPDRSVRSLKSIFHFPPSRRQRYNQIEILYLREMLISDEGLAHLRNLRGLRQLYVSHTGVTDASADVLAGFQELRVLRLAGTRITDEGLAKLQALPHLEELHVQETAVTPAGLKPFREKPGLTVFFDDPNDPMPYRISY